MMEWSIVQAKENFEIVVMNVVLGKIQKIISSDGSRVYVLSEEKYNTLIGCCVDGKTNVGMRVA